jgi:MinD superfamily P-loop ATPase
VEQETQKQNLRFLGEIPYDATLEKAMGDAERLSKTVLAKKVAKAAEEIWEL